jgi:SAM-dependent methyltransferase
VTRCRVLDLGCGNGNNLIPMACQLPESEFIGLDLSPRQVAAGQAQIAELGLTNIRLAEQDILSFAEGFGQFDYILAYGVYSWVPAEVRRKLLEICRQHLAPQGVAYISYNAYPGWHMMEMVRGMMLSQTQHIREPYAKAARARELLDFLVETMPALTRSPSSRLQASHLIIESVRDLLRHEPDEYLLHDQLEANNQPFYLYQFVEQAEQAGLQYLTDAESSAMLAAYFPAEFSQGLARLAETNLEVEQMLDFLYSRSFHQTLLCRQEVRLNQQGQLDPEVWFGLYVASPAQPTSAVVDLTGLTVERFQGPIGTSLATDQPLIKAAMLHLAELWPAAIPFDQLVTAAQQQLATVAEASASATETLGRTLLRGYALDLVELTVSPPPLAEKISERPCASPLARHQIRYQTQVTNQRHEPVVIDNAISRQLLPLLDGSRNRVALVEHLAELRPPGLGPNTNGRQDRSALAQAVAESLQQLWQEALLVA